MKLKALAVVFATALFQVAHAAPAVVARPVIVAPHPVVVSRPAQAAPAKPVATRTQVRSSSDTTPASSTAWWPFWLHNTASGKDCDYNYTEKCEKK